MGEIELKRDNTEVKKEEIREQNDRYLKGLKRYRSKGIDIVIDGERLPEQEWEKIFEVREDDTFYMADYVQNEETGCLKEIRFDRVYNR